MNDGPAPVHAVDDQSEPARGFADQRVVMEHVAQPQQAVEPVAALLEGPARAVGSAPGP